LGQDNLVLFEQHRVADHDRMSWLSRGYRPALLRWWPRRSREGHLIPLDRPNAATLVVADQRIRLSGIDPGPSTVLSPFENWIRAQGALLCEPDAQTGRYRCFTSGGIDVAEAAILNGAGRVGDGATSGYREREAEARQGHRGPWQGS